MKDDKKYHILLVEDSQLTISSIKKDINTYYSDVISLTIMSKLNLENDGSNGDIDEKTPILFQDTTDQIWLSVHDVLTNKYHLILMDTNMQHHTTNALVQILINQGLKDTMINISDSKEQAVLYEYEHIKKDEFVKNFKEFIIAHLMNGSFLSKEKL